MRVILILAVVVLATTTLEPRAQAQDDDTELVAYRALVARAAADFRDQRFAEARTAFLAAYNIHPEPVLLYNIAGTLRHEGKHRQALTYYQRFLDQAADDHDRRAAANDYVEQLRALLDEDDDNGGDPVDFGAAAENDTAPAPGRAGRRARLAGIGVAIAGGVLLGVAVQQQRKSGSIADELAALPAGTPWSQELDDRYADSQSAERRALILAIVGTAATAAGALLYIAGERQRRAARKPGSSKRRALSLYPDLVHGGWRVGLAVEF